MGISLRSCANSGSTKTRLSTRRRRWTHLQPASWDWKAALRNVASKLAAAEGTLSKMAAAKPKAPPPLMPAPCLPADVGPGPAPAVPPGQWGPCPDRSADAGPPKTSLRLPPNVQVLQHQQAGPSRPMPTPLPVTQQPGPGHPPAGAHGQNLVTIVYEGQSYSVPSAFLQS